jgi:hypothetical protein
MATLLAKKMQLSSTEEGARRRASFVVLGDPSVERKQPCTPECGLNDKNFLQKPIRPETCAIVADFEVQQVAQRRELESKCVDLPTLQKRPLGKSPTGFAREKKRYLEWLRVKIRYG